METYLFALVWFVLATFLIAMILLTWAILARDKNGTRTPKPVIINERPKPTLTVVTNPPVLVVRNIITNVRYPING